jgi:hypothetical protein
MLLLETIAPRVLKAAGILAILAASGLMTVAQADDESVSDVPGISVAVPDDAGMPLPADIVNSLASQDDQSAEDGADQQ